MSKSFREDNGGRYDRAGQRPATGFVNAGDRRDTKGAQPAFMPETTATIHFDDLMISELTIVFAIANSLGRQIAN